MQASKLHHQPAARLLLLLGILSFCPTGVQAEVPEAGPVQPRPAVSALQEVTVTGNPLGAERTVAPARVLGGRDLLLERGATLGATLGEQPGVANSYFGPNVGRPAIRGLDGDRIRILQNGGAGFDASALSYDHNPPIDPLAVERVEVLRGPAALLYGGSAQGGVVNVIDNRIPRQPVAGPEGGVTGQADLSRSSGSREDSGAALVEAGNDRYALHADAFARRAGDTRVPVWLDCETGHGTVRRQRICNSARQARGGAVGGTVFADRGYLGASIAGYKSTYGTVAEDDVSIDMRSTRLALDGLWRNPDGLVESVRARFSHDDYRHAEIEDGEAGTVFRNRGSEARLEARHRAIGELRGVWGLQWESTRFSALGEEAFVPPSRTRATALFAHEELGTGWGKITFGARAEQVRVGTPGSGDGFDPGQRRFAPKSAAAGLLVQLAPGWQLTGNLSHTQRAPRDYELFANGPHLATGTWELGDRTLGLERATGIDVGAAWQDGPHRFELTAFASRYRNFIGLLATGRDIEADGDMLPEYAFSGIEARFLGLEASGTVRLLGQQGIWRSSGASVLDLDLRGDLVHARNRSRSEYLPLIAPARVGATLRWAHGPWSARLGFDHAFEQRRVPEGSRTTSAYTLWNASLSWQQKAGAARLLWYVRADNLSDRRVYSATSILTQTAFPKAPLPGRSLRLGLQVLF